MEISSIDVSIHISFIALSLSLIIIPTAFINSSGSILHNPESISFPISKLTFVKCIVIKFKTVAKSSFEISET